MADTVAWRIATKLSENKGNAPESWIDIVRDFLAALEVGDTLEAGIVTSFDLWENEKRVAADAMREACVKLLERCADEIHAGDIEAVVACMRGLKLPGE